MFIQEDLAILIKSSTVFLQESSIITAVRFPVYVLRSNTDNFEISKALVFLPVLW